MATSNQTPARFRSAVEFPQTIESLSRPEANELYEEMRACLVFTNRSRAQLLRRNEEHKQSILKLRTDVGQLQEFINQLNFEKQQLTQNQQLIISDFEHEIKTMSAHLDQLSTAFDQVSDIENPTQSRWSFLALPNRFFDFIRAVKAVVLWWREERHESVENTQNLAAFRPQLPGKPDQKDRRENPQMYTDPASQGRSLLDR
jgi:vacuolar-type H+-ATPase subunit I/STV1